jgi:hypothetical protein
MKTDHRHTALLALMLCVSATLIIGNLAPTAESQGAEKTAEQVYRNIQVFKGLPSSQLLGAMNFMAGSLGVSCNHCHVPNQFAKDDKPAKQTARQHIQMMQSINAANFGGQTVVNCAVCHRGETHPRSGVVIAENLSVATPAPDASVPLPTVEQIIEKYLQAIGGKKRIGQLKTLKMTGTRETRNGSDAPSVEQLEVYREAPNKLLMSFKNSGNTSSQAFNGTSGWRQFNGRVGALGAADLVGAKRDANFYKDTNFKDQYTKLTVVRKEKLGDRDAFVIEATFPESHPAKAMFGIDHEWLYFDAENGLLLRRFMEYRTPLGTLPEATDYSGYRKTGGVMFPFSVRMSRPPLVVTQRFADIRINSAIDASVFEMPVAK